MTTYFVDTSIAVPLVMASHSAHRLANRAVGRREVHLAGHAAIETYSVLTRLPGDARLSAADALTLLSDRFKPPDGEPIVAFPNAIAQLAGQGIVGGAVYDGLVALALANFPEALLVSRDLRAAATYARVGVSVELVADPV